MSMKCWYDFLHKQKDNVTYVLCRFISYLFNTSEHTEHSTFIAFSLLFYTSKKSLKFKDK